MIRPITQDDAEAVIGLAVSSGLFPSDETRIVRQMPADYFGGNQASGHQCVLDVEAEPLGVAYWAPTPATDGTWELTMIAVRGDRQGQGRGAALLSHVEQVLRSGGQRLLLVQTSGTPEFGRTRAFYLNCGYGEEARVRDYFAPGDDMVLFRKVLNPI